MWSQTPEHRTALAEARRAIAGVAGRKAYLSFSGGKDSTTMLHLVLQAMPNIAVFHWDYGVYMPRPIEAEVLDNAHKLGAQDIRAVPVLGEADGYDQELLHLLAEGFDVAFVGIRAQESVRRRLRIKQGRSLTAIREVWPLATWTWMDVWAYITSNNLPYLGIYDKLNELVGYDRARMSVFFHPDFEDFTGATDGVLHWRYRHS